MTQVPCVRRDSGSVRMFNLLRILLGRDYRVTLAAVDADAACALRLGALGVRVRATAQVSACPDLAVLSRRAQA